jgi:hypothetical protein
MPVATPENPNSPLTLETPDTNPLKPKVESGVKKPADTSKVETPSQVKANFPSDYYKQLGWSVCSKCGSKKQTDGFGNIVCAISISAPNCPMLDKEGK